MLGRLREIANALNGGGGPLDGTVEADGAYVGGLEKNKHADKKLHVGRGGVGKQAVIGAVERPGRVTTSLVGGETREDIHAFITGNVNPDSKLYTDEHPPMAALSDTLTGRSATLAANTSKATFTRTQLSHFGLSLSGATMISSI